MYYTIDTFSSLNTRHLFMFCKYTHLPKLISIIANIQYLLFNLYLLFVSVYLYLISVLYTKMELSWTARNNYYF